jgi:hypothetical protein
MHVDRRPAALGRNYSEIVELFLYQRAASRGGCELTA